MKIYAFADEANPMIDKQIAAMKRNGLNGLEIRNVDGCNVSKISLEKAAEVRQKLDKAGLSVWSIGSPIGKIDIAQDDFEEHLQLFRHTLQLAGILGAKNIRLFSFYMPSGEDPMAYRDEVIRRLRMLVQEAQGTGVTLCHENEKGIYGDTAERCLELYRAIPELKGVFDPANFIQCNQDVLSAWKELGMYIQYMHIKDATQDGQIVPAGEGDGRLAEVLRRYREAGGNELTIEPHLTVFSGLKDLEQEGHTSHIGQYAYSSDDAAFDAACTALRHILCDPSTIGYR